MASWLARQALGPSQITVASWWRLSGQEGHLGALGAANSPITAHAIIKRPYPCARKRLCCRIMANGPYWTDQEKSHLQAHYPYISAERMRQLIPNRSAREIIKKAQKMGVRKCLDRLKEMGAENISKRYEGRVFRTPEPPVQ